MTDEHVIIRRCVMAAALVTQPCCYNIQDNWISVQLVCVASPLETHQFERFLSAAVSKIASARSCSKYPMSMAVTADCAPTGRTMVQFLSEHSSNCVLWPYIWLLITEITPHTKEHYSYTRMLS